MNKKLIYIVTIPYFIFAILIIISRIVKIPEIENIFRPLLLFILILWYGIEASANRIKINWLFMTALFFSFLNDILRMPLINNFLLGLSFFLLSQLIYSSVFFRESKGHIIDILLESWLFLLFIFLILSSVLVSLLPPIMRNNNYIYLIALPLLIITIYILVISTNIYSQVYNNIYGKYVLLGGFFFLFSGCILAINRFTFEVNLSSIWVLSSYLIAQWFLVYGYMNSKKKLDVF